MQDIRSSSRRKLLAMLGALPCIPAFTFAATGLAPDTFASISKFATGSSELDADLGAKTLAALEDADAGFAAAAEGLAADAASGKFADVEALEVAVRGTPKHDALLALVSAWYTGTVVVKGQPRVIASADALMYRAISDGSHTPGTCGGATNSWSGRARPAVAASPNK